MKNKIENEIKVGKLSREEGYSIIQDMKKSYANKSLERAKDREKEYFERIK